MRKRLVLVDGYNLIKNDAALSAIEARSLDAARRTLISRLSTSFNTQANDITVVFDGAHQALPLPASERFGPIKVLFSRRGETADTVILRLLAALQPGQPVVLLSDDRALRDAAEQRGAAVGGRAERARPRPTPFDLERKDADAEPLRGDKKGNPRRAKRRDRRPPAVRW